MSSLKLGPDSTVEPQQCLISRFRFENVTRESVIIVGIGPRSCGKTTFVEKYCEAILTQDPEHKIVMLHNLVDMYANSQENIDHMKNIIQTALNEQKAILRNDRSSAKQTSIVIDGLQAHQFASIKDDIREIFINTRHLKISLVITSTYLSLPPEFRMNIDYLVAWPSKNISGIKSLYDMWFNGSGIPNFAVFNQCFKALESGEALVLDNIKNITKWYRNFDEPVGPDGLTGRKITVKVPDARDARVVRDARDAREARDAGVKCNVIRADSVSESNKIKLLELAALLRQSVKLIESINDENGSLEILKTIVKI